MDKNATVWLVYREGGSKPSVTHSTYESALIEAERLSRINDCSTYVLQTFAVAKVEVKVLRTVRTGIF